MSAPVAAPLAPAGRSLAVDLLKIAMAIFVIGIHANPFWRVYPDASLVTGDGLFRLAVPVFLVVNGYFFLPQAEQGRGWAYVRRIVSLYVLWSLLYLPLSWRDYWVQSPGGLVVLILNGYWHLWYLSSLALAAALAVLIHRWSSGWMAAAAAVTFLGGIAMSALIAWQVIPVYGPIVGSGDILHRNGLLLSLPFFAIGMLMRRHDLPARMPMGRVAWLAALGVALIPVESILWRILPPQGVPHDNMLVLGLAAPMVVALALKIPGAGRSRDLGLYANGLFFTHIAVCGPLFRWTTLPKEVIFALTVAGSFALTWGIIRSGLAKRLL